MSPKALKHEVFGLVDVLHLDLEFRDLCSNAKLAGYHSFALCNGSDESDVGIPKA